LLPNPSYGSLPPCHDGDVETSTRQAPFQAHASLPVLWTYTTLPGNVAEYVGLQPPSDDALTDSRRHLSTERVRSHRERERARRVIVVEGVEAVAQDEQRTYATYIELVKHRFSEYDYNHIPCDNHCMFVSVGCRHPLFYGHGKSRATIGLKIREFLYDYLNLTASGACREALSPYFNNAALNTNTETKGDEELSLEAMKNMLRSETCWGGELMLVLLEYALNISIVMHISEGHEDTTDITYGGEHALYNEARATERKQYDSTLDSVRVLYCNGSHYTSITAKKKRKRARSSTASI
jgi:hypothetical protein